ncbi:MAG TPA: ATP-dependent sacrificial sulfur transferase LarE, partial [Nitrospirales bacterium]|nr:ATP-dependent sacrificial sulfur transferase LarE [Nitrospirales bacterium]
MADIAEKLDRLRGTFEQMRSVLVAYSGGIDSTLVLKVAYDTLGEKAIGVTAVSATLPAAELAEARELAATIGARHVTFDTDQLAIPAFARNDAERCFHCKTDLYRGIERIQRDWPGATVVDGTHADDLSDDRPGLRAAREWGVRSPLLETGIGKADVRELARSLGLANADKPAAACLSSRIPRGMPITVEKLSRVEHAEAALL